MEMATGTDKKPKELKDFSDAALVKEFKRRFNFTVLGELQIGTVLDNIGMDGIRRYLRDRDKRIVKYKYKK